MYDAGGVTGEPIVPAASTPSEPATGAGATMGAGFYSWRNNVLKTADGKRVVKGMLLHVKGPWLDHVEKVFCTKKGQVYSAYVGTVFKDGVMDMRFCSACPWPAEDSSNLKRSHE